MSQPFHIVIRTLSFAVAVGLLSSIADGAPANDLFADRIVVTGTNPSVTGSNVGATIESGEPEHAGEPGGSSVWWSWTAPESGPVSVSTDGSSFDTLLAVYTGSFVSALSAVASNDDDPGSFLTSRVEFEAVAGQTYGIAVDGYSQDNGSVMLALSYYSRPTNDLFLNRVVLTGTNVVATGSNVGAALESGEPDHAGHRGGHSVWWSWTAPFGGSATIRTTGSSFDTLLAVYAGSSVSNLIEIVSNDEDPNSSFTSKVEFETVGGQTYEIAVDGYFGETGDVRLQVQLGATLPPEPAPAWVLADPFGQIVSSTNFAGKVVVLNFWATWCGPCLAELPDLVELQTEFAADGLVIIGADTPGNGESPQVVQDFLASFTPAIHYPIVMATFNTTSAFGGINAIPTTFLIDRQNLIRKRLVGAHSADEFKRHIIPLLFGKTRLSWQNVGNQSALCWPASEHPFTLESTTGLANPAWTEWPTSPAVVDGMNTVVVPSDVGARYFRLRMPY